MTACARLPTLTVPGGLVSDRDSGFSFINSLFDDEKMYSRHFDLIHVWQQPRSAFMWDSGCPWAG